MQRRKRDEPGGEPEEGAADRAEQRMGSEGQIQGIPASDRFIEVSKRYSQPSFGHGYDALLL